MRKSISFYLMSQIFLSLLYLQDRKHKMIYAIFSIFKDIFLSLNILF
jgi:hypothetical protein